MQYLINGYNNNKYIYDSDNGTCRFVCDTLDIIDELAGMWDDHSSHLIKLKVLSGGVPYCFHIFSFNFDRYSFEMYLYVNTTAYQELANSVLFLKVFDTITKSVVTYNLHTERLYKFNWGWYFATDDNIFGVNKQGNYGVLNLPVPVEFGLSVLGNIDCVMSVVNNTYFRLNYGVMCLSDLMNRGSNLQWYAGGWQCVE